MPSATMNEWHGSLLLVVDANILHSAGYSEGESRKTREMLEEIRNVCHRVLLSEEARSEWDRHTSWFSQTWRTSMTSRGKIKLVTLQLARHEAALDNCGLESEQLSKRKEDLHLVVAALEHGDSIVISNDRRAANGFRDLSRILEEYGAVSWWNADDPIPPRLPA